MNPDLDLVIERVIRAPCTAIWRAWTMPDLFARWWIPKPYTCRVESFAPHAGGGFVTTMSEDGSAFTPHIDAAFLVVEEAERLVFTNAVDSTLRPANPLPVAVTGRPPWWSIPRALCTASLLVMEICSHAPATTSSGSLMAGGLLLGIVEE